MNDTEAIRKLQDFMPPPVAVLVHEWIKHYNCAFTISRKRSTKLGDYRHPFRGAGHRISVNGDLNQYAFTITTLHELAHLTCWNKYKNTVKPHGAEWKQEFVSFMKQVWHYNIFPHDVKAALAAYMQNPAASSCTDVQLAKTLRRYDDNAGTRVYVEELKAGEVFLAPNQNTYKLLERRRTRCKCLCLNDNRLYLISILTEVERIAV